MKRRASIIAIVALFYFVSYLIFRANHTEIWTQNNKTYVIFPKSKMWLYYLYRPATYVDGKLSGIGFHIGPHQE